MEKNDKLKEMFEKQFKFQSRLGNTHILYSTKFIKDMILATTCELMEALQEVPWKDWKQQQELNPDNFKKELVDCWHFLINLSLAAGLDETSLYDLFMEKNNINIKRQEEGY